MSESASQSADAWVSWLLECRLDPSRLAEVCSLAEELSHFSLEHEPGTLIYEWAVDGEARMVHIYERYTDAAAAMVHIHHFEAHFAQRFRALLQAERVLIYGTPDEDVIASLSGLGPLVFSVIAGFQR